jgi:hypothetical protein
LYIQNIRRAGAYLILFIALILKTNRKAAHLVQFITKSLVAEFRYSKYLQFLLDKADHHVLMELMKLNSDIDPRLFIGVIIGCISALPFVGLTFTPGCMFGLAVATIYFINAEQNTALRLPVAGVITVMGLLCYEVAFWTTALTTEFAHDFALIAAPAAAAIGGFIATWLFVTCLQIVTKKYATVRNKFSLYGGLLGALLIDPIAYVMNSAITSTSDVDPSVLFLSSCIFFLGWQTTMLVIISSPLLKRPGHPITTIAVAGPVNDAARR